MKQSNKNWHIILQKYVAMSVLLLFKIHHWKLNMNFPPTFHHSIFGLIDIIQQAFILKMTN